MENLLGKCRDPFFVRTKTAVDNDQIFHNVFAGILAKNGVTRREGARLFADARLQGRIEGSRVIVGVGAKRNHGAVVVWRIGDGAFFNWLGKKDFF